MITVVGVAENKTMECEILVEFHYCIPKRSLSESDLRAPIDAYFGVLVAELPGGNVRRTPAEQKCKSSRGSTVKGKISRDTAVLSVLYGQ